MSEISNKSLSDYNGEYSYKTWDRDEKLQESTAFFDFDYNKKNITITFHQAREFVSNDWILFDTEETTYKSIGELSEEIYKTSYIRDPKQTVVRDGVVVLKEEIEHNMIGDICSYLVDVFESYKYYIQEMETEQDKEKFFQNLISIFQTYLNKREKLMSDIKYLIADLLDKDENKLILQVFLTRLKSNMEELFDVIVHKQ